MQVLEISDGTTTIDFTGGDYHLLWGEWAPAVAERRESQLGGAGPYEDVEENMAIGISGANVAAVLASHARLKQLLDQAERWKKGEAVSPVTIAYQPTGSGLGSALKAVILRGNVSSPRSFDALRNGLQLGHEGDPIRLSFVRRGEWLGASETENATASTNYNPGAYVATFTDDLDFYAPVKVTWSAAALDQNDEVSGYLLAAKEASAIFAFEAEDGGGRVAPSPGTIADQAISGASDGNVIRLTPGNTGNYRFSYASAGYFSSFKTDARRVVIFALLQNHSSSVDWSISLTLNERVASTITVGHEDTNPQVVCFGEHLLGEALYVMDVLAVPTAASGAGHELDIDYWVAFSVDDLSSHAIRLASVSTDGNETDVALTWDHAMLAKPAPAVETSEAMDALDVRGSAYFNSIGDTMVLFSMAKTGQYWNVTDTTSSPTQVAIDYTLVRHIGYLIPQ